MAENPEKRRRTRKALADALVALCEEKNYYDISVQELCDRAGFYRSTFYRYYETKDQLLRESEHAYLENTRRLTRSLYDFRPDAPKEQADVFLKELTADMEYHRENARLCRFLLSPAGDLYFRQKMIESLVETVQTNLQKVGKFDDRDVHYYVNFFVSGYIATVYEWLLREDRTPEQIAGFLLDMMKQFMP